MTNRSESGSGGKIVVGLFGFLLFLGVCIPVFSGASKRAAERRAEQSPTPAGVATTTTPTTETRPSPSPVPKSWQEVITSSGSADKKTEPFHLTGAPARLRYEVRGDRSVYVSITIIPEGKESATSEVTVGDPAQDETRIVKRPGRYYLSVRSANASWTVTIEEER